ncbi:hypothetical protein BB561_001572 [Smittium simulii]|uniref:Uncharacterized protein n=1 Tax=Smittium simulii TaxID=133385 RepID=A0A2T9YU55_9FUNG|nr:hypothetical protein BB561_001572 [Smittium simulii]
MQRFFLFLLRAQNAFKLAKPQFFVKLANPVYNNSVPSATRYMSTFYNKKQPWLQLENTPPKSLYSTAADSATQLQQKLLAVIMRNHKVAQLLQDLFQILTKNKILDPLKPAQKPSMFTILKAASDKDVIRVATELNSELAKEGISLNSGDLMGMLGNLSSFQTALKSP